MCAKRREAPSMHSSRLARSHYSIQINLNKQRLFEKHTDTHVVLMSYQPCASVLFPSFSFFFTLRLSPIQSTLPSKSRPPSPIHTRTHTSSTPTHIQTGRRRQQEYDEDGKKLHTPPPPPPTTTAPLLGQAACHHCTAHDAGSSPPPVTRHLVPSGDVRTRAVRPRISPERILIMRRPRVLTYSRGARCRRSY